MEESILISIKKMLPMDWQSTAFDEPIMAEINSAFLSLNQLGIGPDQGFIVKSDKTTWDQFIATSNSFEGVGRVKKTAYLEAVKSYVHLNVKLVFDPPTNGSVLESINKQIQRLEWRLNTQVEILNKEV